MLPTEYQVKAAFLFNFAKFVEWSDSTFKDQSEPIIIGIIGEDPFNDDLDDVIAYKKVQNREIVIKRFRWYKKFDYCHILYISPSEEGNLKNILKRIKGWNTLTVGDGLKRFAQSGVIINFVLEKKSVHFEINVPAAEKSNIKISSKLLRLATNL